MTAVLICHQRTTRDISRTQSCHRDDLPELL